MRRMPEDRRLSHLVRSGAPVEDACARSPGPSPCSTRRHRTTRRSTGRGHPRRRCSALGGSLRRRCAPTARARRRPGRRGRAARRAVPRRAAPRCSPSGSRDGRIVDGHGDLIADDVFCLDDGPRVLDCLEFDDRLRYLDGLDDAAFLAMDLERLGRAAARPTAFLDCVRRVLRRPRTGRRCATTTSPTGPSSGPRSACLRARAGRPGRRGRRAPRYAELTLRHLRAGAVGWCSSAACPGTGKTTARRRAGRPAGRRAARAATGSARSSAGIDPDDLGRRAVRRGDLHARSAPSAPTRELLHRAERLLERGESVVIDAVVDPPRPPRGGRRARRAHPQRARRRCAAPRRRRHGPPAVRHARARDLVRRPRPSPPRWPPDAEPWPQARSVDTSGSVARGVEQATVAWASSVRG